MSLEMCSSENLRLEVVQSSLGEIEIELRVRNHFVCRSRSY